MIILKAKEIRSQKVSDGKLLNPNSAENFPQTRHENRDSIPIVLDVKIKKKKK